LWKIQIMRLSNCNLLHPPVTSSLLGLNICSAPCSQTP
jgi:hypothetical protein